MRVQHEAPGHVFPRLVDGTHSLDEFRGPAASQTRCGEHAIADIRVNTGHEKSADRTEMLALFLDGRAKNFALEQLSCRERARESDLDDAYVFAFVADVMIAVG